MKNFDAMDTNTLDQFMSNPREKRKFNSDSDSDSENEYQSKKPMLFSNSAFYKSSNAVCVTTSTSLESATAKMDTQSVKGLTTTLDKLGFKSTPNSPHKPKPLNDAAAPSHNLEERRLSLP